MRKIINSRDKWGKPTPTLCKDRFLSANLSPTQENICTAGLIRASHGEKNRPLRQQKRQKPRKKPRAVSSRVAPVSVGKDKNRKNPLRRMQMSLTSHGRCIRLKIPRASSGIFSRLHHPPYRVLHPAQGDKQKKQTCPPRREVLPP